MLDVAIIGAGMAGLSAAVHLHRAGKSIGIYESKDYIGGRVLHSFRKDLRWIGAFKSY